MNEQNTPLPPAKNRKFPLSALWVISTVIFSAVFAITLAPSANAQSVRNIEEQQGAVPSAHYSAIIRNAFDFIRRHYVDEPDPDVLFEGAMSGMFDSLGDPYSVFLPESDMNDLNDTTHGNFGGVGLLITKPLAPRPDGKPSFLEVAAPIEGTPGWKAGINPGDLILSINGESTDALTSDEAVVRLRGEPGTEVKIVIRRGEKIEFPVTLVRAVIEVPTVKHDMIGDIGYLSLLTFTPMTVERAREAIRDFSAKNYGGLILDLRNNAGGLLQSAVGISALFLDGGVVVSTKSRIAVENQIFHARGKPEVEADIPIIVLINRGSASASEIVAGALKDRGRAYLVGEKSYGKGSVQQVYPLDKAGFKLTTARYYTPSDVNIDKIGIPPDREVLFPEFTEEDADKLNTLINSGRITDFVTANPEAAAPDITAFAEALGKEYALEVPLLKRLIRNEQNRRTIAPVYDLEYDVQLMEAVKILREENYENLLRTTKTLKTLQEDAEEDEELPLAS